MILLILLLLVLAVVLGGSYYAYRVAYYNPPSDPDAAPDLGGSVYEAYSQELSRLYRQLRDREYELVTISADDGTKLVGRYYHVADGAPLDLCFHGYRSRAFTDFAGGSELSFRMDHNVLLVDQRAHGHSEGRTISFGIRERWDVLSWAEYALKRFGPDTPILLYGVSMGAATVLMASALELPANIRGIVADCPYSVPMDIILHVGKTNPLPQWLVRPFAILGAKIFGGFDIREADALEAVRHTKVPILIIHGDADDFVPAYMSQQVQQANPTMVARATFPGADHALSYMTDTPRYQKIVTEFVNKVLN